MGTAGRLSSSPTPARKAQRPNIKTNPAAGGRRAGSRSPVGPVASSTGPSGASDGEKLATPPPSPSSVRHQASDSGVKAPASPPPVLRAHTTVTPPSPEAARKQSVFPKLVPPSSPPLRASSSFSSHIPPPDARLAQRSVSPPNLAAGGKSRHSIVSMHSLESIPELDSDGHTSAADTLERKGAKAAAGIVSGQAASPNSRHSAPETAFPERQVSMGGVAGHKRSTSLTPVHEEKLSHSAKAPQVSLKAQVAPAPSRRAEEDVKLASGATEAATKQEAAKKDAKRVSPEEDKSIQHVRIEGKVAKDTRAALNSGWNRPTSPVETIEASETTTHVVIRIPLRRSASSGVIGEEKRVSIEFLSEQEKESGRRLRSVSTPREVTREATHESFRDPKDAISLARNRSLTGRRESRAEGKKGDSSDTGGRARVRRRSSSRRRRDVISPGPAAEDTQPVSSLRDQDRGQRRAGSVLARPRGRRNNGRWLPRQVFERRKDAGSAGTACRRACGERGPEGEGSSGSAPSAAPEVPLAGPGAEGDAGSHAGRCPAGEQQRTGPDERRRGPEAASHAVLLQGTELDGERDRRDRNWGRPKTLPEEVVLRHQATRDPSERPEARRPEGGRRETCRQGRRRRKDNDQRFRRSRKHDGRTQEPPRRRRGGSAPSTPRTGGLGEGGQGTRQEALGPDPDARDQVRLQVVPGRPRGARETSFGPVQAKLVAQEERYQKQVDQLTISLAEKQQELSRLTQQLEEVKRTYVDPVEMQRKMDEMQLEVREQVGQSESLKVELQYSKNEVELHKMRLQRLEEDLEAAKEKNQSLQTQLAAENKSDRIEELELRLR
ncbi:hypothetical protein C7M84_012699 [Penaeus vannamei]|uniref:Uncharacterized protein n=1 Tax=Penaeus vannamei TaxID=6689 RepID=A0A423SY35_PENVA|nr:hypothetical protein C7M84_012699 [Penaeus vannamei]